MEVKNNQAFAALTDVKNRTGDVFALADQYGEVQITSYNRLKYKIVRVYGSEEELSERPLSGRLIQKAKHNPTTLTQPKQLEQREIDGVLMGLSQNQWWDSKNKKEWEWVKTARRQM